MNELFRKFAAQTSELVDSQLALTANSRRSPDTFAALSQTFGDLDAVFRLERSAFALLA